jgi:hypothetical protein
MKPTLLLLLQTEGIVHRGNNRVQQKQCCKKASRTAWHGPFNWLMGFDDVAAHVPSIPKLHDWLVYNN